MKKIFYLLAFLPLLFTACQKQPNLVPTSYVKKGVSLTLQASDYALLPKSDYAHFTGNFISLIDANTFIPVILNARDPQLGDGSTANVTFSIGPIQVADSSAYDVAYTVTSADYFAVTGNHYGDFSASDVLKFLAYKYPAAPQNQLAVLTYVLYTGSDNTVTNSFLFLNGKWKLIYQVSPAQYTEVGDGAYDNFDSSEQNKLVGYFNFFLKNDLTIMDTVKTGDVEYISYQIYAGNTYQKVMALTYDGSNFNANAQTATLAFVKSSGAWIPNPTVYYTLTTADTQLIAASTIGTAAERTNLGKYGDFSGWAPADLDQALILVLTKEFPSPKVNIDYDVTYLNYTGGSDVSTVVVFDYSGTAWSVKQ